MAKYKRGEVAREKLVTAAGEVFAKHPYSDATVADVLKRVELTQGSLYFHFRNKRDLALAVISTGRDELQRVSITALTTGQTSLGKLRCLVQGVAEAIRDAPVVAACLRLTMQSAHEFPEVTVDPYALWQPIVHGLLTQAVSDESISTDADIEELTWLIVSAFMGGKEILAQRGQLAQLPERATAALALILELAGDGD